MPDHRKKTTLEKRVKRHVIGREKLFFASTSPGFEFILNKELSSLPVPIDGLKRTEGGVEFSGKLQSCYVANLKLRTAHRVLMRLYAFSATNFRQLERKLADFPWELYLRPESQITTSVTARHSRLYHGKAIRDCIMEAVQKRFSGYSEGAVVKGPEVWSTQIFIRAVNNRFTLSLDSTGELLHRRGIKTHHAAAPLRETSASAALMLAGYDGSSILLDPMCGAGTFSLEGALILRNIPPGWFRSFAFMSWPAFRPARWRHMKKELEKDFYPPPSSPQIIASDIDSKVCGVLENTIAEKGLSDVITVSKTDFFNLSPSSVSDAPGTVAINPPYGRRIGSLKQSDMLFKEISKKLKKDFKKWKLVLIVPRRHLLTTAPPNLTSLTFHHGGMPVTLLYGLID